MVTMKIHSVSTALGELAQELSPEQAALIALARAELDDAAGMAALFEACFAARALQTFAGGMAEENEVRQ